MGAGADNLVDPLDNGLSANGRSWGLFQCCAPNRVGFCCSSSSFWEWNTALKLLALGEEIRAVALAIGFRASLEFSL